MKNYMILGLFACLILVSASCDITGDLNENKVDAGDEVEFEVEISPTSGFVEFWIENPVGDRIYSLKRQINEKLTIAFKTNDTFLNGTYEIGAKYLDYYENGSLHTCNATVDDEFELSSPHSMGQTSVKIKIDQTYEQKDISSVGVIQKDGVTYDVSLTGQGVPSIIPNFLIEGADIITGYGGGGNLNLNLNIEDEEIKNAASELMDFYYDMYEQCNVDTELAHKCVQANAEIEDKYNATLTDKLRAERERDSRVELFMVIILFVLGIIIGVFGDYFVENATAKKADEDANKL